MVWATWTWIPEPQKHFLANYSRVYFQVSPLVKKTAILLGPSTIGSILEVLLRPESQKAREFILLNETIESLKLKKSLAQKNKLIQEVSGLQSQINDRTRQIKMSYSTVDLKSFSKSIEVKIESNSEFIQKRQAHEALGQVYQSADLSKFLNGLLRAWSLQGTQFSAHSQYMTEQVLLTLALMNTRSDDKNQFIGLYRQIPQVLVGGSVPDGDWMNKGYSGGEYLGLVDRIENQLSREEAGRFMLENPEQAFFMTEYNNHFSGFSQIGFRAVNYVQPTGEVVSFPNCVEAAILNFIGIVLKSDHSSHFASVEELNVKFDKYGIKLSAVLADFIQKHPDTLMLDHEKIQEEWSALLQNHIQKISYKNSNYNMLPTMSNLFGAIDILFTKKDGETIFSGLSSNTEKMKRLVQVFSENCEGLNWTLQKGSESAFESPQASEFILGFKLKERQIFTWSFSPNHSEIRVENIQGILHSNKLWPMLGWIDKSNKPIDLSSLELKILFQIFNDPEVILRVRKYLDIKGELEKVFQFAFSATSVEAKIGLLKMVLLHSKELSVLTLKRILSRLPLEDLNTQFNIFEAFFVAGQQKGLNPPVRLFLDETIQSSFTFLTLDQAEANQPSNLSQFLKLLFANGYNRVGLTRFALELRPSLISARTQEGQSLMHLAATLRSSSDPKSEAWVKDLAEIRELMDFLGQMDPTLYDSENHEHETPIFSAIRGYNFEATQYLISKSKSSIQSSSEVAKFLVSSCDNYRTDIFSSILQLNPRSVFEKDSHGNTILHHISRKLIGSSKKFFEIIFLLLKKNPEFSPEVLFGQNDVGQSPLEILAEVGDYKTTKVLLDEIKSYPGLFEKMVIQIGPRIPRILYLWVAKDSYDSEAPGARLAHEWLLYLQGRSALFGEVKEGYSILDLVGLKTDEYYIQNVEPLVFSEISRRPELLLIQDSSKDTLVSRLLKGDSVDQLKQTFEILNGRSDLLTQILLSQNEWGTMALQIAVEESRLDTFDIFLKELSKVPELILVKNNQGQTAIDRGIWNSFDDKVKGFIEILISQPDGFITRNSDEFQKILAQLKFEKTQANFMARKRNLEELIRLLEERMLPVLVETSSSNAS